ncbi:nicotinate (nicotinamide) nucleotide adenylyltransferase [Portibacter lacus]|uniref:Probable nicotinate-nucleotide adenylyltransferase n=1 Tax=Portibacter lacus TaxID=1099794 RepID=A0AA37SME3_9BACT|nr:nicotinate (nicotinamide) nucleotide adenylyltransferase [Portibacter lacus]GLR16600.1 putative nicotinate-nucleotide adenylyltransferase [Portibacter lacus]
MKIGLYFGSFNPVHVGHMIIANHIVQYTDMDQLWMVVSPHNPHKNKKSLAKDYDRLHLVTLAIAENPNIRASNIEFSLPKPSYTIDTLTYIKEKYPDHEFSLIMGGDNLGSFHKWKNYEIILKNHDIYVYKRPSYELGELENHPRISIVEAPMLDISSSFIRNSIKNGRSIQYLVPQSVFEYIESNKMYT